MLHDYNQAPIDVRSVNPHLIVVFLICGIVAEPAKGCMIGMLYTVGYLRISTAAMTCLEDTLHVIQPLPLTASKPYFQPYAPQIYPKPR